MGIVDEIKKSAKSSGATNQTSEEAKLESILNKMFYLDKNIKEETKFVKQVMTRGLESQERVGLHASAMLVGDNDFCLRAQVLSLIYKQRQGEKTPINLKRIFEEGNAIHEKWQRMFIRAGYGTAEDMDRTRIFDEYRLSYTPDIVCLIPDIYEGKMIGEIKSVNTMQFRRMTKHPSAWKQNQWYSHLCMEEEKKKGTWNGKDYLKGFVLSDDKNTQSFRVEIHNYDPKLAAPFVERAESIMFYYDRVFEEHKMVKRPPDAVSPQCKRCSKCFMRDACWNIGMGRIKIES